MTSQGMATSPPALPGGSQLAPDSPPAPGQGLSRLQRRWAPRWGSCWETGCGGGLPSERRSPGEGRGGALDRPAASSPASPTRPPSRSGGRSLSAPCAGRTQAAGATRRTFCPRLACVHIPVPLFGRRDQTVAEGGTLPRGARSGSVNVLCASPPGLVLGGAQNHVNSHSAHTHAVCACVLMSCPFVHRT